MDESQIIFDRARKIYEYNDKLKGERGDAIASIGQAIMMGSNVVFARQAGLLQATTFKLKNYGVNDVMKNVKSTVSSTDIPEYAGVAKLLFEARLFKTSNPGQSTPNLNQKISDAVALAQRLDKQRPWIKKVWITDLGSYEDTTRILLHVMNLVPA